MQATPVTALLITRNEETHLGHCLNSVAGLVDDLVVVDTGSTDDTVAIARRAGARVGHLAWTDDFAAARNHAIGLCRTPWALYIDADERIAPGAHEPLRSMIDPRWLAADVLLRPKVNYTRYRLTRLFRIDPRIRFQGAIHETLRYALAAISGGADVGLTALEIDHFGYEGDLSRKHKRNLPLLERCAAEFPERVFYWFHLTETLLGLGRHGEALAASLRAVETARRDQSAKSGVDAAMACQMLASSMLGRDLDPRDIIEDGLELHPGNHGLLLTLASRELRFGDAARALAIARTLRAIDPDSLQPDLVAYDRNVFRRYALEVEIASLSRLGRMGEATLLLAANAGRLKPASAGVPPHGKDKS